MPQVNEVSWVFLLLYMMILLSLCSLMVGSLSCFHSKFFSLKTYPILFCSII